MSYSLDVELFISEIAKRPVIWDMNSEDSRHKNRKQRAWEEIAKKFIQDFDEMSDIEQMEVYRKLHGKWRNIRDSYVRDMRKKPGQKRYMYAKHLHFLDNLYKQSDTTRSDDEEWSEEGEGKKRSQNSRFTDVDCWQSGSENSLEEPKRKKLKKEENPLEYFETPLIADTACNFPVEDEDKSFFDSLLPAVRSFDIDQKLEFRSEVLSLVKKIRKGQSQKDNTIAIEFDE